MKKTWLLLSYCFVQIGFGQNSTANKSYQLSLQQAIDHALQYNINAVKAGKDIEIAKHKKWETTALGLPQINGSLGYQNNLKIATNVIEFGGMPMTLKFGQYNAMDAKVTLNQLIFDGSYLVGLQASKVYLELFENAKKKSEAEIKETITNAYGNVLLTQESIAVLEKNEKMLSKNYNDANQIFINGLGEQETVEQISILLATVKSNLNNVKRLKDISLTMLKISLGMEVQDNLTLTDQLENLTKTSTNNINNTVFNLNNLIDYQMVNNLIEQKKLLVKLEQAKYLPSLGASLNFGANSFNNRFNFIGEKWYDYSSLMVGLNIPIFSSFATKSKIAQAKLSLQQAQDQQKQTAQLLTLQYEKAKSEFDFSIEEFDTSKNNLALAERIEQKQQLKFKEGLSSSFEFSEAQRQLYAAQQSYLQSMVNVITKRAALEKSIH